MLYDEVLKHIIECNHASQCTYPLSHSVSLPNSSEIKKTFPIDHVIIAIDILRFLSFNTVSIYIRGTFQRNSKEI